MEYFVELGDIKDTEIYEMLADQWRPVDYEALNKKHIFDRWANWMPIFYAAFMEHHRTASWN